MYENILRTEYHYTDELLNELYSMLQNKGK